MNFDVTLEIADLLNGLALGQKNLQDGVTSADTTNMKHGDALGRENLLLS